jgi:glycosyltransferase involved in cell wall biosynthesis
MINYVNYHGISFKKVIDCYDSSDIVVFASFHEGFGMPIVEANAIGRPIICSNVCSLPEIAGDAALFVNPYSVDEIRNSIISLINDKCMRDYYVKKGLINAEKYSQTNIADQYIDIYKKIK